MWDIQTRCWRCVAFFKLICMSVGTVCSIPNNHNFRDKISPLWRNHVSHLNWPDSCRTNGVSKQLPYNEARKSGPESGHWAGFVLEVAFSVGQCSQKKLKWDPLHPTEGRLLSVNSRFSPWEQIVLIDGTWSSRCNQPQKKHKCAPDKLCEERTWNKRPVWT